MLTTILLLGALTPAAPAPECWTDPDHVAIEGRRSPLDSLSLPFAGDTIKVCYGRPSARGRTMVGGTEEFGEPWRLGANEATSISLPVDVRLGDLAVPAGRYSLYVIPDTTSWRIVVNRAAERWGVPINGSVRGQDFGSTVATVEGSEDHVESLTIRLQSSGTDAAELVIEWERRRVRVPIARR